MENIIQNYIDDLQISKTERIDKSTSIYDRIMKDPELTLESKAHIFGVTLSDNREHFLTKASHWLEKAFKVLEPAERFAFERYIITNFSLYPDEVLMAEFTGTLLFEDDLCSGRVYVTNRRFIGCGYLVQQKMIWGLGTVIEEVAKQIAQGGRMAWVVDHRAEHFLNRIFNMFNKNCLGFQVPFFNADSFQIPEENVVDFRACIPIDDKNGEPTLIFSPRIRVAILKEQGESKDEYIQRCRHIVISVQTIIKS